MPDTSDHIERSGSDERVSFPPDTNETNQTNETNETNDRTGETSSTRPGAPRRRRGSRGGKNRKKSPASSALSDDTSDLPELPDLPWEGQPTTDPGSSESPLSAQSAQSRPMRPAKPKIGDSIPAPLEVGSDAAASANRPERPGRTGASANRNRNNRNRERGDRPPRLANESSANDAAEVMSVDTDPTATAPAPDQRRANQPGVPGLGRGEGKQRRRGRTNPADVLPDVEALESRRGRERNGKPIGRYLMAVHVRPSATQIAVLEGRSLIEHYVSQAINDSSQIHGNIYLGRVQNVLPGMEAAFVDIGTPKNAVLYRSDVAFDSTDLEGTPGASPNKDARIEHLLKNGQLVVCQVTKNPIGQKGARLTQEVSLPGRFVVLVPNSGTYGISKRLPDDERKRLRRVLDEVRPAQHGIIVRTAASGASADELRRDVQLLVSMWEKIDAKAKKAKGPVLLNREPDLAVRIIREEFNGDYRGVVIDDREVYDEVRSYVESISPELADRVEFHDPAVERLPIFEQYHVHEQLHKAIDRKVWLPSGGSLIIERTEALTVIDVNTGKNVGSTSLEETVYKNNLEAAQEIARQLRLRDIGGIIVIDFIDMEIRANRASVVGAFREALSRDKTRSQVFEISELGLVEMTRKRISEGLVEALSDTCPTCNGRGFVFDPDILDE